MSQQKNKFASKKLRILKLNFELVQDTPIFQNQYLIKILSVLNREEQEARIYSNLTGTHQIWHRIKGFNERQKIVNNHDGSQVG